MQNVNYKVDDVLDSVPEAVRVKIAEQVHTCLNPFVIRHEIQWI